jgi:hypothetical protein
LATSVASALAPAFDIAAADHEIGLATLQQGQHDRQLCLVVLQVGIDDRGARRARCQNAFDTGPGQAAPVDPPDTADAGIAARQISHHIPGAIGRIIINEDDFPGDAGQRGLQLPQQRGDVVAFVEGGDDDRKLRQTGGLRRIFGARSDSLIHAASLYPQPQEKPRRSSEPDGQDTDAGCETGQKEPRNANDHEQRARVHPAQPSYSVVVPAPEL